MPIDMDPGEESEDPDWGRLPRERKFVERGINYFTMRVPNQWRLKLGPNYRPRRLLYPNSRKSIGACRAVAAQPVGLTDVLTYGNQVATDALDVGLNNLGLIYLSARGGRTYAMIARVEPN